MTAPYDVQRGATARWLLWAPVGTDLAGWNCGAALRPLPSGMFVLDPASELAAELVVEPFEGAGERGPGWYLTLTAAACDALAPRMHLADARIVLPNGEVAITSSWQVRIAESASRVLAELVAPGDPEPAAALPGTPTEDGLVVFTLELAGPGAPGAQTVAVIGPKGEKGDTGDVPPEILAAAETATAGAQIASEKAAAVSDDADRADAARDLAQAAAIEAAESAGSISPNLPAAIIATLGLFGHRYDAPSMAAGANSNSGYVPLLGV